MKEGVVISGTRFYLDWQCIYVSSLLKYGPPIHNSRTWSIKQAYEKADLKTKTEEFGSYSLSDVPRSYLVLFWGCSL
jgi:hypothetical protein